MYGKLIDGSLRPAPTVLEKDGLVHYNPSEEMLLAEGYLPISETPYPDANVDDHAYYIASWKEQDRQIVQVWTAAEPPTPVEPSLTTEDRLTDLERRVNNVEEGITNTEMALVELYEGAM